MAEVGTVVAEKVVDSIFAVAKKEIGYMWNCKENVENFRNEAKKLEVTRGKVQELIDIATRKGDKLSYGVEEWVKEADTEISKAEEFLQQEANAKKTCCKIGLCGNWGTLHHYGKSSTKMAPSLLQLQERGSAYESCVSVETPAPGPLDVYQNKDLEDLVTHNEALKAIVGALEDETKQIIGIYGLGGVGKTTLAKEVVTKVKYLFVDVAFTTVSQNIDAEKIKKDLENATKRIVKGEKVLIILDDVWAKVILEDLCIPYGDKHKNCKILLTSRSEYVCEKMNACSTICVNALSTAEAWIIFKRVVGEQVETDVDLKPVAMKVVEECGGLPLLIQAVGNALKHKNIKIWKLALSQLKKNAPAKIDPDIRKAFVHLQLSYDYLDSEEAKACFLLCSFFPEDSYIELEDLVNYGVGLEKFDDLDSIEDARGRVQNAVNTLTSSGLLLKDDIEGLTKMHDVVRDVALLISSQGNNKYMVKSGLGLTEWLPRDTSLESYSGISLIGNQIIKLPDYKVNVPHLEIFLVHQNRGLQSISDEFIGCMKKVKVLDISWNNISSLPQSFQLLTKVRTLDLRGNESLQEISILGELKDVEILVLNQTGIHEIPKEIARLVNLRALLVKGCENLSRITHGVISALSRLEELSIVFNLNFKGASDCIAEIMSMSKLKYLDLTVPGIHDIPAQVFSFKKFKGFVIQIGEYYPQNEFKFHNMSRSGRYLVLSKVHLGNSFVNFLNKVTEESRPHIVLKNIENLNNIIPSLYDEGFNKLEHIELQSCPNVLCLVDEGKSSEKFFKELKDLKLQDLYKLEVIWKCPEENICLTNLVRLHIYECKKLERVLTVSVAKGLVNLKELSIGSCDRLEEVIWGKGGGGDDESRNIIVLPSLTNIFLCGLPSLKRFFNPGGGVGNENCSIIIKYPSLVDVMIYNCESMEIWGPGIHETPNLKTLVGSFFVRVSLDGPCAINDAAEKVYEDLKKKLVGPCA